MSESYRPHIYVTPKLTGNSDMMEELRITAIVDSIVDATILLLMEGEKMEIQIGKDLSNFSHGYSKSQIKKTYCWIEFGREEDLLDEHSNNLTAYHYSMIEAKMALGGLPKGDPELYAERYSKYINILHQMYELMVINADIERQIDPPSDA